MKSKKAGPAPRAIYAIGYSTMPIERFMAILRAHTITRLVDVRTVPRSRYNPSFDGTALANSLKEAGITYVHLKELGGLRRPLKGSVNVGWRNASFRGFADHMGTEEFERGLEVLIKVGETGRAVMMCAEGNPFRCHRSLIADALTARGISVMHISSGLPGKLHRLTPFAEVNGYRITYPTEGPRMQ